MRDVEINKQPVELYKVLKFEGLAQSGGAAKMVIDDGRVKVNGAVETQRRKKIVDGDKIELNGETLNIIASKTE